MYVTLQFIMHIVVLIMQLLVLNTGEQPSDNEVQQLLDEVEKYTLASHLLWGLWGIVSVGSFFHSNIYYSCLKLLIS